MSLNQLLLVHRMHFLYSGKGFFGDNHQPSCSTKRSRDKVLFLETATAFTGKCTDCHFFSRFFSEGMEPTKVQSGFSLFSIRKDFLSTVLGISHFLVYLSLLSLFAFVVSGSGVELRK